MRDLNILEMDTVAGGDMNGQYGGSGSIPYYILGQASNSGTLTAEGEGTDNATVTLTLGSGMGNDYSARELGKTFDYIFSFEFLGLVVDDYLAALRRQGGNDPINNPWSQGKVGTDNNGDIINPVD
jgi:hypothetical protein